MSASAAAPVGALAEENGTVLLIGVNHTVNTSIHFAEKLAGRRQFIRWALTRDRVVECPGFPGDSEGFEILATDLEADIFQPAWELFQKVWHEGKPVRLLGVGVSGLTTATRQLSLFGDAPQERAAKLAETVDRIRAKYGWEAVKRASRLKKE